MKHRSALVPLVPLVPLALLALLAAAPRAHAQDRAVYPGDRVRVTDAVKWTGMVQGVSPDTLDVVPDGERASRPVALSAVKRLEISLGERGRGIPFLIGAVAGAGLGAATAGVVSKLHTCADPHQQVGPVFCETVGPVAVIASALIGFAAGGAVGSLLGGGERWVRATMPARIGAVHFRLQVAPLGPSTPQTYAAR